MSKKMGSARMVLTVTVFSDDQLGIEYQAGSDSPEVGACELLGGIAGILPELMDAAKDQGHGDCNLTLARKIAKQLIDRFGEELQNG